MKLPTRTELVRITEEAVADTAVYSAFRNLATVITKENGTPVTEIDLAIQAALFARLGEFDDVHLVGEEGSRPSHDARYAFAIDPLDGTGAYIRGIPTSSTVVTLLEKNGGLWYPQIGVIRELRPDGWTWSAEAGGSTSAHCHDGTERNSLVKCAAPYLVTVSTWPNAPHGVEAVADTINHDRRFSNQTFGSIALGAGLIAEGATHATVFAGKSALETVAMSLIVRGACGVATDFAGKDLAGYELSSNGDHADFVLPYGAIMAADDYLRSLLCEIIAKHN